ncbi:hypothetical protein EV424DRAFT_1543974 [Suillus variegatus]|nr:hypothetical protein EV424DRAFT_1543974 [Suillus variegatus]
MVVGIIVDILALLTSSYGPSSPASFSLHSTANLYSFTLVLSPDSRHLAYTTFDEKIHICDIPANILASIESTSESEHPDLLNFDATYRTVRRTPVIIPVTLPFPRSPRPLSTSDPHTLLRFLRKLLPSSSSTDTVTTSSSAIRSLICQPIIVPQRRVPHGFFDDLPDRAHHTSHASSLRDRISSLFRPIHLDTHGHNTSSRPRPFHWVRNRLSGRSSGEDTELREAVVDVPYPKGKRERMCKRKTPPLKPGNIAASTSLPPNGDTTSHFNGTSQAQCSQAQAAVSTATPPPVVTNTTPNTNPHVIIRHAGRWTRFWLYVLCLFGVY